MLKIWQWLIHLWCWICYFPWPWSDYHLDSSAVGSNDWECRICGRTYYEEEDEIDKAAAEIARARMEAIKNGEPLDLDEEDFVPFRVRIRE